jgi:hypothetical protein
MKEMAPAPDSVASCQQEISQSGLALERAAGPTVIFHLVDPRSNPPHILEKFHSERWTELECAQAAVRFTRYFHANESGEPAK